MRPSKRPSAQPGENAGVGSVALYGTRDVASPRVCRRLTGARGRASIAVWPLRTVRQTEGRFDCDWAPPFRTVRNRKMLLNRRLRLNEQRSEHTFRTSQVDSLSQHRPS